MRFSGSSLFGLVVGAGIGYLIQPTLFSVIEGAVIGALASVVIGLILVIVILTIAWLASK